MKEKEKKFGPKYLDKAALDLPDLAFAQAKREILRMAGIVKQSLNDCFRMFSKGLNVSEEVEHIQKN